MKYNWDKLSEFEEIYAYALLMDCADKLDKHWVFEAKSQARTIVEKLIK